MLSDKQQLLTEEFSMLENPQDRLGLLVDRSRGKAAWPPAERTDERRVHGCISAVWLKGAVTEGFCEFSAEADSPMVKALVQFLASFYSGATPADVATRPVDPLEAIGLADQLTPTRRNGLAAVVRPNGLVSVVAKTRLLKLRPELTVMLKAGKIAG